MAKQITLKATKDRIEQVAAEKIQDRLEHVANYAVKISPVDTGAYVESFSMVKAGQGGGRSRKSDVRPNGVKKGVGGANPETFREVAKNQLREDIEGINIKQMLEQEDVRFTLRNRAPHANTVEDGRDWQHQDGYYVFTKIRKRFG